MQSSEIESMPYYEVEYTLENLMIDNKKQNEEQEAQQESISQGGMMKDAKGMMKSQQSGLSKSINTPKMPKISAPSISRPSGMKF